MSVLFFRLATYLLRKNVARPVLVDFEDGAMTLMARMSKAEVEVVVYPESGVVDIPSDSYAVFQSMTPWSLFPNIRLHPATRLLFWNCHPYNLVLFFPGLRFITYRWKRAHHLLVKNILFIWSRDLKRFIQKIYAMNGLVFMDQENRRNTEKFNSINLDAARFLPIPVEIEEISSASGFSRGERHIRVTWIGRLVDFKYYPLKRLLASMNRYCKNNSSNFSCAIIGSGPYLDALRKYAAGLSMLMYTFMAT